MDQLLQDPILITNLVLTSLNKTFGIAVSKKPFDILHPTKEGHRLRYVSLEGPSAEVYVRGKLKDSNTIELPDYWKGLVDPESITVTLTPIGTFQELFYEEVEWCSTIKVVNGGPVNCSYTVFNERKIPVRMSQSTRKLDTFGLSR